MDKHQLETVTKRLRVLQVGLALLGVVFLSRLFYLQVVRHDYYSELAISEHQSKFVLPAERGTISVMDGDSVRPIVLNQSLDTLYADPYGIKDAEAVAGALSEKLSLDEAELLQKLQTENSRYQVLATKLTPEVSNYVKEQKFSGIGLTPVSYRVYPQTSLASHLLGFVNSEGQGQYGLEGALDDKLGGSDGKLKAVTDAHGIPLSAIDGNVLEQPVNGDDVTLTVDINLQQAVEDALEAATQKHRATSASAVVLEVNTGAVKAMANFPSYNPEEFAKVSDYSLFTNEVVSSPYETGSGIKVFTLAAGLNEGAINPSSTYEDYGQVTVGDVVIKNALPNGLTVRSMDDIIQRSLNTGAVHVLEQLGGGQINLQSRQGLYKHFTESFGFGSTTGIDLASEAKGVVHTPEFGQGINVRYANMAFGQGMTVTMMQMAAAMASVVNGGTYYQPHVVAEYIDQDGSVSVVEPKVSRTGVVSNSTSEELVDMMKLVVEAGGGRSAKRAGYSIGGKTGSAQIPDEQGRYREGRTIGSFTGFVGSDDPEYIVMVRIDEPQVAGFAGTDAAAPLFAEISNWLIDYFRLPPSSVE